ncbi:MAG: hypothetical protein DWQ33_11940 [Bacteroidetes bacterium]|nr:MAG: hypothetical protein DWQ33_11940 [Bacteroidota bacterium]
MKKLPSCHHSPEDDMSQEFIRYERQMILPGFGTDAQRKLFNSKVAVVGAGGLACPALMYLAAAGVGNILIIDGDIIELSNLHRQVLYQEEETGFHKAATAAHRLKKMNSEIYVVYVNEFLTAQNAIELLKDADVVLDCTDNFPARYLINDACEILGTPWVYGSVYMSEGQMSTFNLKNKAGVYGPSYRCLFPKPPKPESVSDCKSSGVIGVVPGIIGLMQAIEVIKILTGKTDECLRGKLYTINAENLQSNTLNFVRSDKAPDDQPKNSEELRVKDYPAFCEGDILVIPEIDSATLDSMMKNGDVLLADMRSGGIPVKNTERMAPEEIAQRIRKAENKSKIVVICNKGNCSRPVVKKLLREFPDKEIYSLQGGMSEWEEYQKRKSNE